MMHSLPMAVAAALFRTTVSASSPVAPADPSLVRSVSATRVSTDSLLTTDVLTNMTVFGTAFMKEPASVTNTGRNTHHKSVMIDVNGTSVAVPDMVDMVALAAEFPAVATDFKTAHFTAEEWEQQRRTLFAALIAMQRAIPLPNTSAIAQNVAFLQSHLSQLNALIATDILSPQIQPAPSGSQPSTLAEAQAQDQAQTAQFNQAVAAQGPIASPRDTTKATVGHAHVLVDYGRPSKRGREVFGTLVPYGQVWRTGANMATTLVTDKDLEIGTLAVPAGSYTLYTIPSPTGWQLILNKENGQWGLVYRPEYDLGKTAMTISSVKTPVETFVIQIADGKLRMQWDTTTAEVAITEKK